jgi:CRP-like cAMP-binding protein
VLSREQRSLIDRMGKLPLLGQLGPAERRALATAGQQVTLPDHWSFVHERTPADACYIVLSGEARVLVHGQEVARVGEGELIGEAALLEAGLRTATVTACGPIELLRLDYTTLARLLQSHPHLHQSLLDSYNRHHTLASTAEG